MSGAWPGPGRRGPPSTPDKIAARRERGNFCGPPRLIARDRRSAAAAARRRGTWHALLSSLLFLQTSRRLGTRLLGSLLSSSSPPSPFVLPAPSPPPPSTRLLFPSTLARRGRRRTEVHTPDMRRCTFAHVTYFSCYNLIPFLDSYYRYIFLKQAMMLKILFVLYKLMYGEITICSF